MYVTLPQVSEPPRFHRALPQKKGVRSCPVVVEAGRLGRLGEIYDMTGEWASYSVLGTSTPYWPYGSDVDGGKIYVLELKGEPVLVRTREDALNLIEAVGHFLNFKAHRPWNILGLLVAGSGKKQIVQIVVDYAERDENWAWGETLIEFAERVAKAISEARPEWLDYSLEDQKWWRLSDKDARYWSPQGGVAPIWAYVKDNNAPTKTAKSPLPGQLIEGATVANVGQGHPLPPAQGAGPDTPVGPGATEINDSPNYLAAVMVAALIIAVAVWASAGGEGR